MRRKLLRIVSGTLAGAIVGYAYYHFIGCHTGTCPLTGNPSISVLYGSAVGALVAALKK